MHLCEEFNLMVLYSLISFGGGGVYLNDSVEHMRDQRNAKKGFFLA